MPHSVSNRTYWAIGLLASSVIVSHSWLIIEKNSVKINPFPLYKEYTLSLRWYVYFMGSDIAYILIAASFLIVARMNQLLQLAARCFFIYSIIDLALFLLYNNTVNYTLVLGAMILTIVIVSFFTFNNKHEGKEYPTARHNKKIKVEYMQKKISQ